MSSESYFAYDVFLSHSSKDKPIVRDIAERLRKDGIKVWFDEWELKPGDSIPARIEHGLENSRVLVLCMSENAFGSDWAELESNTFRFRDPLNKERRFIPLRLDSAEINGSLAQFLHIDWREENVGLQYSKLLESCLPLEVLAKGEQLSQTNGIYSNSLSSGHTGPVSSIAYNLEKRIAISGSHDTSLRLWDLLSGLTLRIFEGHTDFILGVSCSTDGQHVVSCSADKTLRIWDLDSGECVHVLVGHKDAVLNATFTDDGVHLLSCSADKSIRIWHVNSGACLAELLHDGSVTSVVCTRKNQRAVSGSADGRLRVWDLSTGTCLRVIGGHIGSVSCLSLTNNDQYVLSGSVDSTLCLWDLESGQRIRTLDGHSGIVRAVTCDPDGKKALTGSYDTTIRVWSLESGTCLRVLEGHSRAILSTVWMNNNEHVLSCSFDNTLRVWDIESGKSQQILALIALPFNVAACTADGRWALTGSDEGSIRVWDLENGLCRQLCSGHSGPVTGVTWTRDNLEFLSGSADSTLRLWDANTGMCLRVFEGHSDSVTSVASIRSRRLALSSSIDETVRVWDLETGRCLRTFGKSSSAVTSVFLTIDGRYALSGSYDCKVRFWEVDTEKVYCVLEGHTGGVTSVTFVRDSQLALSGSHDCTLRVWDLDRVQCLRVLEGHVGSISCLACSGDGKYALSGSVDGAIRLWDIESGLCIGVLNGHGDAVTTVLFAKGNSCVLSVSLDGVMQIWDLSNLVLQPDSVAQSDVQSTNVPIQLQYTNAKVLLVGDSGVGKTGLSKRLAFDAWEPSDSTVGAWATQWKLPCSPLGVDEREIWLWDFGGQADQRLIHQLYMDETALAILVFDGQKDDLFQSLGQWDRDLTRASRKEFVKILVAGRVDAGGLRVSRTQIESFKEERKFIQLLETSAKTGQGCAQLKQAILDGIRWDEVPWRTSPLLFKRIKEGIISLKDAGRVLLRFNKLRETLRLSMTGESLQFTDDELHAVIGLLAGPGVVWELKFGSWILLQPDRMNTYAQAAIQTMRADKEERGWLAEERVLNGDLAYQPYMSRLDTDEERFILLAMHQTLVERGLCLREQTEHGAVMIFPSYYRRERPELVGHPAVHVSYLVNGFLDEIYATLVVRLHHTKPFESKQLWRYAADFNTLTKKQLGVKMIRRAEGAGELEVYFDSGIPLEERIIFSKYVHEHLLRNAKDVVRLRHYVCPYCGLPAGNREVAMKKLNEGKKDIACVNCDDSSKRIPLWDEMEEMFSSAEMKLLVRELEEQSAIELDNESKERALVGDVISTVALAGQICRELTVSDHGIDMEIEFKDNSNNATAKKLYLQLKSGDSYLRERKKDGAEIFTINKDRHVEYWMAHEFPVFLVIRNSEGEVRWMEIRDYLKRVSDNGKKPVKQIVFEGERFDVMSVRRWRDRLLSGSAESRQ